MSLVGEGELKKIAEKALMTAKGTEAEAVVMARTGALTRFANSAIHQNVVSREASLTVRVAHGTRVASVTTERLDDEGIAKAAREASELARLAPESESYAGLPERTQLPLGPTAYRPRTDEASPLDRARLAKVICDASLAKNLRAAGYVATNTGELAVANSRGVWAYVPQTVAEAQAAMLGDAGSAFAQRVAVDIANVDAQAVADEALAKAIAAQGPRDHPIGELEVVLEPYATFDLIQFLTATLNGISVEEGRSYVGGRTGEKVTGAVTIVDDPLDPRGLPRSFDFEGRPSKKVVLIDNGIARGIVYDAASAKRAGVRPTGHAMPGGRVARPMSVRLEAGDKSREELIKGVKKGVLITRFWSTRWVHQLRTIITGMTRDGTFAIENGEIAYPVKNFRFTQSYHEALGTVRGVGRELHLLLPAEQFGLQASWQRVPALHLGTFNMTGATQY